MDLPVDNAYVADDWGETYEDEYDPQWDNADSQWESSDNNGHDYEVEDSYATESTICHQLDFVG